MDLQYPRVRVVLLIFGVIAISMAAEKFREMVGEEAASKSGKFTLLNCFDMGSGTLACIGKEGVKLYVYSIRSKHVENIRQRAIETALTEALKDGLTAGAAAKQAQKLGQKAAKSASRQAKRIAGPIVSSGWDFFEAVYYGGTMMEAFFRGTGTLFGTYAGGFHGEEILGKLGYLLGSHLGSWVGGRIGLMAYDMCNGAALVLRLFAPEGMEESQDPSAYIDSDSNFIAGSEDGEYTETSDEKSEGSNGWGFFTA